jgi:hypothetical protein
MQTIELNMANETRAMSDADLDAVAGGFVTYHGGGGGKVVGSGNFAQEGVLASIGVVASFVLGGAFFGL